MINHNQLFRNRETREVTLVTIPVAHFRDFDLITRDDVCFRIFRDGDWFKAVPQLTETNRKVTCLPEELLFIYWDHVILASNNTEDESMEVIKNLILDLEVQGLV